MNSEHSTSIPRRKFIGAAAKSAAGIGVFSIMKPEQAFSSAANSKVQLGIIGTGGRGTFDGRNLFKTGKVEIYALADYFDFQMKEPAHLFEVDAKRCFDGIDGYKEVLALDEIDAVLLTTAPYFRPIQFKAAVEANKHVFAEKPIAVDPWGCHTFLAAGEKAKRKKLTVGVGLQTRDQPYYQKLADAIQNGAIGRPLVGHSTRISDDLWRRERPAHFSELDHQIRHWLYYLWASGDFINEMHIHNIDVFNWFTNMLPVSAYGRGGRDVRLDVGDIYDNIEVLYEYPNGFNLTHTGTQISNGLYNSVKHIIGTDGYFDLSKGLVSKKAKVTKEDGAITEATVIEMENFVASVLGERPTINNSGYVTSSTFTCILGRTAAYEKRKVTWKELWDSKQKIEMPV